MLQKPLLPALLALCLLLPVLFLPAQAEKTSGVVRVLLTKPSFTDKAELSLDGSYTVNGLAFQRGSHLTVSAQGSTLYVYYEGMSFSSAKEVVFTRHAVPDGRENGIRLNGAYELHPGDLHLTASKGRIQAVLHAPVEEYLLGVVPYEMNDSYPLEALKAQAVAARTYAMRKAQANEKQPYDLEDNTNDQVYFGVKKENNNAARAVRETAGMCGYYKGSLAMCYYSASNGGQTELPGHVWGQGDWGYLAMTDDPYDVENKESVVKSAKLPKKLSGSDDLGPLRDAILGSLSEVLESKGYDGDTAHIRVTGIEKAEMALPMYTDSSSRIMTLLRLTLSVEGRRLIEADEEDVSFASSPQDTPAPSPAESSQENWSPMKPLPEGVAVALDVFPLVESALNLSINSGRNEIITVRETDTAFVIESRRYGHGVGMSQRGAQQMAGTYKWTCEQILRFYYPGMSLKTMSYSFALPEALNQRFLSTPGPAATPTPRPTLMPLRSTPGPREYQVQVLNIGVNSYLNLRSEPNTQAVVVRQLYYGQSLIVTEDLGEWLRVRTDDVTGYVMTGFVQKTENAAP